MKVQGMITLEINGKVVRRQRMRSFIRNFIDMLAWPHGGSGTVQDVANVNRTAKWGALNPGYGGYISSYEARYPSAGIDDVGIVVGTGSTVVALNDYDLAAKVATGNGAGQLAYQAQGAGVTTVAAPLTTTRFTRSFINNSGGSIIVAEVGMMGRTNWTGTSYVSYLMLRDVIGVPVTVLNGATLNVYVDLQVAA